jgi:hypothetical protein
MKIEFERQIHAAELSAAVSALGAWTAFRTDASSRTFRPFSTSSARKGSRFDSEEAAAASAQRISTADATSVQTH